MDEKDRLLNELFRRARKCTNKGRYYVYEQYKRELDNIELSPSEYEQTCRELARLLRV